MRSRRAAGVNRPVDTGRSPGDTTVGGTLPDLDDELRWGAFLRQYLTVRLQLQQRLVLHRQAGLQDGVVGDGEEGDQGAGQVGAVDLVVALGVGLALDGAGEVPAQLLQRGARLL